MELATVERAPRTLSPITERSLQSPPESAPSTLRSHPGSELLLDSPPPLPASPTSTFPSSPSSSNFATAPSSPSITSIPSPLRRDRRSTSSRARAASIQRGPESPTRLDPSSPLSPTISGGGSEASSPTAAPPLPQTQARRDITPSRLPRPTPALPRRQSSLKGPRVTPHGARRSDSYASRATPPPLPPVPPVPPLPPSLASATSLASYATSITGEPSPPAAPSTTSGSAEPQPRQLARTASYSKRKPVPSLEDLRVAATRAAARDASPSRASMSTGSTERLGGSVGGTSLSEEPSTGQASSEPVTGVPLSEENKQISLQNRSHLTPNGTAIRARRARAVRHRSMDATSISAPRSNPSLKIENMPRPSSTPPSPRKGTPKALVASQPALPRSGSSRPFSLPAFGLVRGQSALEPGKRGSMEVPRAVSADHRPRPSSAADKRRPGRMLSPSPTKHLQSTPDKLLDPDESSSLFKRRSGRLSSLFSRSKPGKTPTASPRNSFSGLEGESLAGDTPIRTAIRTSGTFGVRDDGSDHADVRPYGSYDFAQYHPRCTSAGSLVDANVRRKLYAQNADAPSEDEASTLGRSAGASIAHDKTQKLSPLPEFGENATLTTSPSSPPSLSRSSSDHTLPSTESMHRHLLQLSPCSTSVPSSMHNSVHNSARNSERNLAHGHPSSEVLLLVASHMLSTHAATLLRHAETMNEVSTTMRTMAAESLEWGSRLMGYAGVGSIHSTPAASSTPQMPSVTAFDLKGFPTPPNTTPAVAQTRPAVSRARDVPVTLREDSPTRSARPAPVDALIDDDPLTPVPPRPTHTRKASGTSRGKGTATGMPTIPGDHAPHTAQTLNSDHGATHHPAHDPNLLSPPSNSVPHRPQSPAAAYLLEEADRLGRDGWANLRRAEDVWTRAMTDLRDMARDIANGAHMVAREAQFAADASAAEASAADASAADAGAADIDEDGSECNGKRGMLWYEALAESEGYHYRRKPRARERPHLVDDHTPTVRRARRPLPIPPIQANGSAAGRTTPTTGRPPDSYSSQSTPTQARPQGPRSNVPAPIPVPSAATSVASPLNSPVTSLRPPPRLRHPSRTLPSSQSMPVGLDGDKAPPTLLPASISSHELGSTSDVRSNHSGKSAHKANNIPSQPVVGNGPKRPVSPDKPNGPLGLNITNGPPVSTLEAPESTCSKAPGEQVRQVEPATLAILSRRGTQTSSWLAEAAPNADPKAHVERCDTITSQRPLSSRATSPLPLPPGAMAPRYPARGSLSPRPSSPVTTLPYAHSTSSTVESATSSVHSLPHTLSVTNHTIYGHTPYIYTHNSSHTPGPGRESPAPHFHPPPPPSVSSTSIRPPSVASTSIQPPSMSGTSIQPPSVSGTSIRPPSVSTTSLKSSLKFLDPRDPPPIPSAAVRGIPGVPTSTSLTVLHIPKTGGQGGTGATPRPSLTLPRPNPNPNRRSDSHIRTVPTQPALASFPRSVSTTTLTSRSRSTSSSDISRRPSLSLYRRLRARHASPASTDFSPAPNGRRESGEPESAHSLRKRWLGLRWGK